MILDIGQKNGIYVVPPVAGAQMKVGDHSFSLCGDPDMQRLEKTSERQQITELCSRRFRDFHRYRVGEARICFYTVQPEERFIVKPEGKSLLMTGFSGHGFKFGALMGQAAAQAVAFPDKRSAIEQWAAGRSDHSPF
jgi:glycine/D-amino acid oxidase-like deaminating enzyme